MISKLFGLPIKAGKIKLRKKQKILSDASMSAVEHVRKFSVHFSAGF